MSAQLGDSVRVCYRATLTDGTIVDADFEHEPFEFTLGTEIVIPGFEKAIIGMQAGESKRVLIEPAEAYGDYQPERVVVVARSKLPSNVNPHEGMMIRVGADESTAQNMTITALDEERVTLDGNHRLAGKVLSFEIQLVAVNPA